jgi:hypothetical protein
MLFRDEGSRLEIMHLHETWLPDDVLSASDFSF